MHKQKLFCFVLLITISFISCNSPQIQMNIKNYSVKGKYFYIMPMNYEKEDLYQNTELVIKSIMMQKYAYNIKETDPCVNPILYKYSHQYKTDGLLFEDITGLRVFCKQMMYILFFPQSIMLK